MIRELFLEDLSLWSCVWQSTLLIVIGLVGSFLYRHRPARAFQVLLLAMIAAVAVPAMSVLVRHYEIGAFVAEPAVLQSEMIDLSSVPYGTFPVSPEAESQIQVHKETLDIALTDGSSNNVNIPWRMIMLSAWLLASIVLLGRLIMAFISGVRMLRGSTSQVCDDIQQAAYSARAKLGITKSLNIRSSREIRSPMIWCWNKTPAILVPNDLDIDVDWVAVICHELAHFMRRDHVSGLTAEIITCILCWNPLSWLAIKRLIRLGEQACDDWVVVGGRPVESYARSLLNFKPQKQVAFVPAVVHSGKGVAARVRRILKDSRVNPRAGATWALTMSILIACLAIGLACAQTRPAKPVDVAVDKQEKSEETLHKAVAEGDVALVKSLISKGADVNAKNEDSRSGLRPLHIAARAGHANIVELLINKGADVSAKDSRNYTPLYYAVWSNRTALMQAMECGHTEVVELLIRSGADVNVLPKGDSPPLHYAIWRNDTEMAKILVNRGADFNLKDSSEWTALRYAVDYANRELVDFLITKGAILSKFHLAAWRGDLTVVKRFLDQGTDVNIKDDQFNWTPLHWATFTSQRAIIEFLIAKGADVNAGGEWNDPPLHYAAVHGHKGLVELLLAKGAGVNSEDNGGKTALHDAARQGHRDIVELLINKGADVDAKYGDDETALHRAAANGYEEVVELLATHGADINARDKYGRTPLFRAVSKNYPKVVEVLASNGADINAKDKDGRTPLYMATPLDDTEIMELLVTHGADVNAKDKYGRTPLYVAYQLDNAEIIDLLRKYGATGSLHYAVSAGDIEKVRELIAQHTDVNQRDDEDQTLLYRAVLMAHVDVAELLLNRGANIDAKTPSDETGYTSLQLAADRGQLDMVKLLVARGADVNAKRQKEGHKDRTAKSYALGRNYKEIVEFLYAHGADIPKINLAAYRGDLETVRSLIESGTEVDAKDDDGTPLHYAAMAGHEVVAQYLIDSTANVNAGNRNGWTPLHFSAIGGSAEVARILVVGGADVEVRSDIGQTPLLRAASEGNKGVVEVLLDNGAGINISEPYGYTPLHYAARYGHRDVVELLLDKKASIEARLTSGHTPMALAELVGHTEIADLLRKHGAKE
jgi:ankyrin repeat protein/beta-lactamase regulating signal transducer with metallopeptidase domain